MDNTVMKRENNRKQAGKQTENKQKTSENFGNFLRIMQVTQTTHNLLSHLDTVK